MRYIQGKNANIHNIYEELLNLLQEVGWRIVKQNDKTNIDKQFGSTTETFMKNSFDDIIYVRIAGWRHNSYWVGTDFYAIDIGPYIYKYDSHSMVARSDIAVCFIESKIDEVVDNYTILADERSIISSFYLGSPFPRIGGLLSAVFKTESNYLGGILKAGVRRYKPWDSPNGLLKDYSNLKRDILTNSESIFLSAGEKFVTPNTTLLNYPFLNALKNDDFAPLARINIWYIHTDRTWRHLGYIKDIFRISKNGLKQDEIITQASNRYIVMDLYDDLFYFAVKLDEN